MNVVPNRNSQPGEIDLRGILAALKRRRGVVVAPTVVAFVLIAIFVTVVSPKYQGEAQVLLENQETFLTRPDRAASANETVQQVDPEAVGSQVQLITSRDLALRAIKELGLRGDPEFDPTAKGVSALRAVLMLVGLARDPARDSIETRMAQAFGEKLTVFSPPKTRVITIQFQSKDPILAARAANKVAELYLLEQSEAKRAAAKAAADALADQITDLRVKLASADAERERYRAESGLLAGSNNMTLNGQELADINGDLSKARASQADAQAKATMIRDLLRQGKAADVPDVVNNDLVRQVANQRVSAQSELEMESRTLLPGHPRVKALAARVAGLDVALKGAAKQAIASLENEARIAGQRVANLEAELTRQKKAVGASNGDAVRLRSLDRIADSYKDQLESSTTKYQEAIARETSSATPADARIIARAVMPQEPIFPKKMPFLAFGTVATFVFAAGFVIASEVLATPAPYEDDEAVGVSRQPARRPVAPERGAALAASRARLEQGEHDEAPPAPSEPRTPPPDFDPRVATIQSLRRELSFAPAESAAASQPPALATLLKTVKGLDLAGFAERIRAFGQSAVEARGAATAVSDFAVEADHPHDDLPERPVEARRATERRVAGDHARAVGLAERQDPFVRSDFSERQVRATAQDHAIGQNSAEPGVFPHEAEVLEAPRRADPLDILRSVADRVVADHVPGRGLHLVGATVDVGSGAVHDLITLGRVLSERGRAIIVDLNASPIKLAMLVGPEAGRDEAVMGLPGLSELLSGGSSFAEVIHRDHASRLHFIPAGRREADYQDFDLILDALSATYDFILLLAPSFPQSEIAKVMAPYAHFVVLSGVDDPDSREMADLENDLIEAGAREVLVLGRALRRLAGHETGVA